MKYRLQEVWESFFLKSLSTGLIHTVPAQYTLICQSIVGLNVDPIRLGQPDPFAFDQADLFQFLQELHCFLLAAAHLFNDLIYRKGLYRQIQRLII